MSRLSLIGMSLRLLGPVVEIVGLILLLDPRSERIGFAGMRARPLAFTLISVGLVMVIAGLVLSTSWRRRRSKGGDKRPDLDLHL